MMDLERAKELQSSLMWASVVEELDRKIHFEMSKLRTCQPEELAKIQLMINCFESLKSLPQDVVDRESQ
jgi:hypothetical protein